MANALAAVLVFVTAYYAFQTWRMVKVMEKQLALSNRPVVYIRPVRFAHHSEGISLHLYAVNGGRGPALSIEALYMPEDRHFEQQRFSAYGLNSDSESKEAWDILGNASHAGTVLLTYNDVDGREFSNEQTITNPE